MLVVLLNVLGNGVTHLGLTPGAFGAIDNRPASVFLGRLPILGDHLKVFDVQCAQVLVQL